MIFINLKKKVLTDSINYAKHYEEIIDEQYQTILACRETVLKNNESTLVKTGLDNFNVPMGGYDSAQIANRVVFYIFDTLSRIVNPIQLGLYNNDGILYLPNSDGSKCSSM